ncbi:MAG: primase [Thermodesulfobacteriota bacterium]|nr:primase [Thermodesulfobacteriota bacterium]
MKIPPSKISEIASAADIVQVISAYVNLKRAGKDFRGICPFHGDKDPSFYVSPQKGIFHCFGCSVGGSVFHFLMRMENWTFVEAVQHVAQRYGVALQIDDRSDSRRDGRKAILEVLELGKRYFLENLSGEALAYLLGRDIPRDSIGELQLGFAPDRWDGMVHYLRSCGASMRDAQVAGLIRQRADGSPYDYFRSRIMVPIRNINGQLIAFGGRVLGDGDPKYLNSPESEVFRKKSTLYGLDTAREGIRREGCVIVVEGYFDQISLRIRGFFNTVAPLGTALGSEQVRLLKRFTSHVKIIFDSDEAGIRALKRSIPLFLAEGLEPSCVLLQEHKDPDEAIRNMEPDSFKALVDQAVPAISFFLDYLQSHYDLDSISGRNLALEETMPILREIPADSVERDYFIEKVCSRLHIKEERLRAALRSAALRTPQSPKSPRGKGLFEFPADERNVVRGMILIEGFLDTVQGSGVVKDIQHPVLSNLAHRVIDFRDNNGWLDPGGFLNSLDDEGLSSLVASWVTPRPEEDDLRQEPEGLQLVHESLDRMRRRKLEQRKTEIKERMRKCLPGDDEYNSLAQELLSLGRLLHK